MSKDGVKTDILTGKLRRHREQFRMCLIAFTTRLLLVFFMAISSNLIPSFYPGDDVMMIDLRLSEDGRRERRANEIPCFCLKGHVCDSTSENSEGFGVDSSIMDMTTDRKCADYPHFSSKRYSSVDWIYKSILIPLTRWDAARFLTLAVDPKSRYPHEVLHDEDMCTNNERTHFCNTKKDSVFALSEQAHAFLPGLPTAIRYVAFGLIRIIPHIYLPATFEGVAVFSALLWNVFCFAIATVLLHNLTFHMIISQKKDVCRDNTEDTNHQHIQAFACKAANVTAIIFSLNPSNVFFVTSYSESTFCLFTLFGYYFHKELQERLKQGFFVGGGIIYLFVATLFWMLASYTRSNGSIVTLFLFLTLCANMVTIMWSCGNEDIKERKRHFRKLARWKPVLIALLRCKLMFLITMACTYAIILPVMHHDQMGYSIHCTDLSNVSQFPDWCLDAPSTVDNAANNQTHRQFSLYAHVQRKHWNLGFLRYYQWKQIPNFLLAAPILFLSACAVLNWIRNSWIKYTFECNTAHERWVSVWSFHHGLSWVIFALRKSVEECDKQEIELRDYSYQYRNFFFIDATHSNSNEKVESKNNSEMSFVSLLLGTNMLAHYAILAVFFLLGSTVAHIQVSTRLICSSCPAIYWYMSSWVLCCDEFEHRKFLRNFILGYLLLFNVLGVIMHVNWLPWT